MQTIQWETRSKKKKTPPCHKYPSSFDIICVNICFPFIGSHIPASYLRRRPFGVCIGIKLCATTKGIRFTLPFAGIQPLYSEPSHFSGSLVFCYEMNMEQKKTYIWWRHFVFSATKMFLNSVWVLRKKEKQISKNEL